MQLVYEKVVTKNAKDEKPFPDYEVLVEVHGRRYSIGMVRRSSIDTDIGPVGCWSYAPDAEGGVGSAFDRKTLKACKDQVEHFLAARLDLKSSKITVVEGAQLTIEGGAE